MSTDSTPTQAVSENADILRLELRRRDAYRLVFGAGAAMAALGDSPARAAAASRVPQFAHGVASGDPRRESVIIWTRVTPPTRLPVPVQWKVSTTPDMAQIVASGQILASEDADYTVKIDVRDLTPGGVYWYQFTALGIASPIGRTRTLPPAGATAPFSLAVFSCSNFEKGFFNAYGEAAKDPNLSAVVHLGDYTYEYGLGQYVTPALAFGVVPEPRAAQLVPTTETVLLDAYRQRQALYHTDPQLQALHAHAPWILIYDDHESANDAYTRGAENHDPATEGGWIARKAAALRAYYEWLPLREPVGTQVLDPATGNPTRLPRSFAFGRLARLFAVDTRLAGRDRQLTAEQISGLYVADAGSGAFALDRRPADGQPRTLLGTEQEQILDQALAGSQETWQILANQVLVHYQIAPDYLNSPLLTAEQKAALSALLDQILGAGSGALFGQLGAAGLPNPAAADSWVGYPSARNRLDASLKKARNPIVLSGDSHNAWAANLRARLGGGATEPVGVEFGTASVSSPGLEEFFLGFPPELIAALSTQSSQAKSPTDRLIYADTARRGFVKLHVDAQRVQADFVYVSTAFSPAYTVSTQSFTVQAGAKRIQGT